MKLNYIVKENCKYTNINQILINEFNISSRLRTKLIRSKHIYQNSIISDTRSSINLGDLITIDFNYEEDNSNIVSTKMKLDIIYEDEWLIVINKSAGIPVHPSMLHYTDSLSNGIRFYFDSIGLKKKIRPVNRLDLNTSGLVVFAKCEYIQEQLSAQMQTNDFKKEYICLVEGHLNEKSGIIDLPISRKPESIIERCVSQDGQKSITDFAVLKEFDNYSLVKCILKTGRTHQIRVHFSFIGHPLLGDTLYGHSSNLINRQALHSYRISFIHPVTKHVLSFETPVSEYFKIKKCQDNIF